MSNKLSTKILSGIFFTLLLVVIYVFFINDNVNERTFRNELVSIDTSKVDAVYLYPKATNHSEVLLAKSNNAWQVKLENGKFAEVPHSKIQNLFNQLLTIKPKRLASRDESKWSDYQVDSNGTRIKVTQNNDTVLDIILGRFSFQQPRSMSTFVRLSEDTDVYEVDGFLEMTFNQNANSFRNNSIVTGNKTNWQSLTFVYPADSSFRMEKREKTWFVENNKTDSSLTEQFLNKLSRLTHTEFEDNLTTEKLLSPTYSLKIDKHDTTSILINGYMIGDELYITSSQNENSIFKADNNLKNNIFIGVSKLLSNKK